jgi:SAM-dependent methyltransferase
VNAPSDPLRRFSDLVEDYVRYRPGYPSGVIAFLQSEAGLGRASVVADIGAGTGIFTRLLLATGARVIALEPNDAMRAAAEDELSGHEGFASAPGSAEATGLADQSVSLITCAQAFHWFEPAGTRREFSRILQRDGGCAVLWNTAVIGDSPFAVGYEALKVEFGTDFQRIRHEAIDKTARFDGFFGAGQWTRREFANPQTLDFTHLKGRLLSSSYAPKPGHPRYDAMIAALEELFARCAQGGVIKVDYKTEVYFGRFG